MDEKEYSELAKKVLTISAVEYLNLMHGRMVIKYEHDPIGIHASDFSSFLQTFKDSGADVVVNFKVRQLSSENSHLYGICLKLESRL